jgi:hypothetical protein
MKLQKCSYCADDSPCPKCLKSFNDYADEAEQAIKKWETAYYKEVERFLVGEKRIKELEEEQTEREADHLKLVEENHRLRDVVVALQGKEKQEPRKLRDFLKGEQ